MKYFIILLLCPILSYAQPSDDITGVWKLKASSWDADTKEYADCDIYKFITATRWASIFIKPNSGIVAGSAGGTYKWEGDIYTEKLEYFSFDSTAVGTQQRFSLVVNDHDQLIQEGIVKSEKYNYDLYNLYEKVDDLYDHRASENFLTGTYRLQYAQWGEKKRSAKDIKRIYGEVIKIFTPKYYLSSFFDKANKKYGGVSFGTQKIKSKTFDEILIAWSWDQNTIGDKPSFEWSVDEGIFHQYGKLNKGDYIDYIIDERYERIEK